MSIDMQAEAFAAKLLTRARKELLYQFREEDIYPYVKRAKIEAIVRGEMPVASQYNNDGGRMVEYVTDALCSEYDITE